MKLRFKILIYITFCGSLISFGQDIELTDFRLYPDSNNVLLDWCLESGSVCNGMAIYRSTDNVNYEEIGSIPGVCGSSLSRVSYNFIDKTPVNKTKNYYKLLLGYYQYSEVKIIDVNFIEKGRLIITTNYLTKQVTFEFNNKNKEAFALTIYDLNGHKVYYSYNITNNIFILNSNALNKQYYIYQLSNNKDILYNGKILITE